MNCGNPHFQDPERSAEWRKDPAPDRSRSVPGEPAAKANASQKNRDGDRAQREADPAAFEQRLSLPTAVRKGGPHAAALIAQSALPRCRSSGWGPGSGRRVLTSNLPPKLLGMIRAALEGAP